MIEKTASQVAVPLIKYCNMYKLKYLYVNPKIKSKEKHQSRTRKRLKNQQVGKSGERAPPTKAVVQPSGFSSRVLLLKDTSYNVSEHYHIPPDEGIKH